MYYAHLNLANSLIIFTMCTHTDPSPTVALYPFFYHAIIDTNTGASLEYHHLMVIPKKYYWIVSTKNEIGILSQLVLQHMKSDIETMFLLRIRKFPKFALPLTFE